jgi:hypothetical protein
MKVVANYVIDEKVLGGARPRKTSSTSENGIGELTLSKFQIQSDIHGCQSGDGGMKWLCP